MEVFFVEYFPDTHTLKEENYNRKWIITGRYYTTVTLHRNSTA